MVPFSFPLSKCALWDPLPMGDVIGSHVTYYRNPKLSLLEKTLRLAYRHAKQNEKKSLSCFLLGTLAVSEDGEGVTLTIDRFDPGREVAGGSGKIPTASLPGDFLIPCTLSAWGPSSDNVIVHSAEDISSAFKGLQNSLCSKESLDLSKLLTVRAHIVFTENLDNLHFNFHWASVTVANTLEYTPVKSVPIIPTALARNLNSPMSIAQVQGTCKCGYLTMDQTRKLLLLLESDPKAYALPLVGVWLSGVTHICSPQVWACCLRYLFSSSIQERVFSESGSFLIVLYSLTHKEPEFYECIPCSGQAELGFQILTCHETVQLFKNVEPSDKTPIQFELSAENQNAETEFFSRVCKKLPIRSPLQGSSPSKLSASDHDSGVEDEDLSPRPIPSPHPVSQQVTRIFPSVPELSLILDGSFVESGQLATSMGTSNAKSLPSVPNQPIKKKSCLRSTYHPTQHSEDRQNLSATVGDPSLRQLPNPINQKIPASMPSRGKQALVQQQQMHCKNTCPQSRKSSGSSSPSIPCSGPSPETSVHHPRKPSEGLVLNPESVTQQGEPPVRRTSVSSSKQLPAVTQPVLYNSAFSPESCRHPPDLQVPVQVPPCCPGCSCQCPASIHYNPVNSWQGIAKMNPKHGAEIQLEMAQQKPCAVLHQNIVCPNICCNPGYATSSPISASYHGKAGSCSLDNSLSPGMRMPSSAGPSSPQLCAAHSPCLHTPASKAGSDNGMMGLSPDAYRVLTEQDRQLKLLQAQIQRLLEAQARQACSSEPAAAIHALQPERQRDLVSMETQTSPRSHTRRSVSVAVSTGASLFWNTASEKQDDSIPQGKKEDEEISKEDISISISAEPDTSNTSIASSLRVVDIPSFVESTHLVEEGTNQNIPQNGNVSQALVRCSSLEESVSVSLQKEPSEGASNQVVVTSEQNSEPPALLLPRHPSGDQRLYQDLLGQVNHLLKSSEEQDHLPVKSVFVNDDGPKYQNIGGTTEVASETDTGVVDKEKSVISATLKQLKSLGVTLDSPGNMKKNTHKVENASILACINPEAVVPGLNYMSFANVSMCGLTPNVVDLSMEANAIALKYLSENQLSRLSLSRSGQNPPADFSFQDILHSNTDKSMVGLSLISPNNMSFATKKYMKRYGLIQGSDSSEDEEELQVQDGNSGTVKRESMPGKNCAPVLDSFNHWTELSRRIDGRLPIHLKGHSRELTTNASPPELNNPVLRNIANEIFLPRADQADENSVQFLKDLKSKTKLLPGRIEFTEQPGRKDGDTQVFPGNLRTPTLETLNQSNSINSVGTILDVKQLRQLPKLF